MTEKQIQRAIQTALGRRRDCWFERRPGGLLPTAGGRLVQLAKPGTADLSGAILTVYTELEVKVRAKKKSRESVAACKCPHRPAPQPEYCGLQSLKQRARQRALRRRGCIYLLAHDAAEAVLLVDQAVALISRGLRP